MVKGWSVHFKKYETTVMLLDLFAIERINGTITLAVYIPCSLWKQWISVFDLPNNHIDSKTVSYFIIIHFTVCETFSYGTFCMNIFASDMYASGWAIMGHQNTVK
jgi:hypothetical protein